MRAVYSWWSSKTHKVFDTGFQLLTSCGSRISLTRELDEKHIEKPVSEIDCFDCIPSPLIFWANER